jgi:hypothetical protein
VTAVQNVVAGRYSLVLRCKRGADEDMRLKAIVTQDSGDQQCTRSKLVKIVRGHAWKKVRACTVIVERITAVTVKLENKTGDWKTGLVIDYLQLVREE